MTFGMKSIGLLSLALLAAMALFVVGAAGAGAQRVN